MMTAISARGLIPRDKMGSAEPYLKLYLHPDRRFAPHFISDSFSLSCNKYDKDRWRNRERNSERGAERSIHVM